MIYCLSAKERVSECKWVCAWFCVQGNGYVHIFFLFIHFASVQTIFQLLPNLLASLRFTFQRLIAKACLWSGAFPHFCMQPFLSHIFLLSFTCKQIACNTKNSVTSFIYIKNLLLLLLLTVAAAFIVHHFTKKDILFSFSSFSHFSSFVIFLQRCK